MESLAAILYVALAGFVTADALLKKSDVRAALGWIAAAWLSPVFGSLLYYMFGINRVTRRALKLKKPDSPQGSALPSAAPGPADPALARMNRTSERITGAALSEGNAIAVLEGGDQAYERMLAAIEGARQSVALASYIFRDDGTGREFVAALAAAQARGVQVRVLLDGFGTGYLVPAIYARLRHRGVPAARFLHTWLPWRMPFLNMRSHRKILVVDGCLAFMGGMNIADEYARSRAKAAGKAYAADMHFQVEGPASALLMDTFARDWEFTTGEELNDACWWPAPRPAGSLSARAVRSGPDNDLYKIETMIGAALSQARHRVRIVTPYFLPDARLQFAIAQAGLRGVTVDIVIPARGDQRFMDWAMRGNLRFFQHVPATIHQSPPPFDHAKLIVMDDEWCLIGSSNWDARSLRLNFEIDLECYDRALAARIGAIIDAKIALAQPLNLGVLTRQPLPVRLRNAACRLLMPYL